MATGFRCARPADCGRPSQMRSALITARHEPPHWATPAPSSIEEAAFARIESSGRSPGEHHDHPDRPGDEQCGDHTPPGHEKPDERSGQYGDLPEVAEGETQRDG
jgi:hypothetical protein